MNINRIKVSLIIPTYNEEKSFERWITSLHDQLVLPDEIIVIDGGSQDKTLILFRKHLPKLKIPYKIIVDPNLNIKNHNGPIGAARNKGIILAKYENIVCTDMGVNFSIDWFLGMKTAFENGAEAIKGKYTASSHPNSNFNFGYFFTPSEQKYHDKSFLPSSRNIGFTKSIWEKAGQYPENSYTGEDTLFALNVLKITDFIPVERGFVEWSLPCDQDLANKIQGYARGERKLNLFYWKYFIKRIFYFFFRGEKKFIYKNESKGYFNK